ncbi:MAG: hypothetical protein AAF658_12995, partial [Myxococcota bacterium]
LFTVFLMSVAVMAGVIAYFYGEWEEIELRDQVLTTLDTRATEEGPCAALEHLRGVEGPFSYQLRTAIDARRPSYAREVLASRNRKSISVYLDADEEGLIDRTLCEEIRLTASLGEPHPVMALLRFTREEFDPCDEADAISDVLRGLNTHRPNLLAALMEEPRRMNCFEPDVAQRVASFTVDWLMEEPTGLDDGPVQEASAFLNQRAPVRAAQLGCALDAKGTASKIGNVLGCSQDMRERVLLRYRHTRPLPTANGEAPGPSGADVLMIGRNGSRCDVRPVDEPPRILTVTCDDLELVTDVRVAVRIENLEYGLVRADMIAGVADYDGRAKRVTRAGTEPELGSWFAYDLDGGPLGTTQVVSLAELADRFKEELPSAPIRSYCRSIGAKYCYDVDWTKTVKKIDGEPTIFLSRPLDIFLERLVVPLDVEAAVIVQAFGAKAENNTIYRLFRLGENGTLALQAKGASVELRWRRSEDAPWQRESIGEGEGGGLPPAARLLAAMDLEQDGTPELLVQRVYRALDGGRVKDTSDEIVLMVLEPTSSNFQVLNRLTVHEY